MNDDAPQKVTRARSVTHPVNLKALRDRYGNVKAAAMLGITDSGLSSLIQRDRCSTTIEKLATLLLVQQGDAPRRDRLLIIKVTPTQMDGLRPVIEAFGARIAFADDA